MNFFGHVAAASWRGAPPAVALGAMLPDLASMAEARPAEIERADVRRGVEFHYATDAAFHRLEAFTELCGRAASELRAAGLGRGSARGAAHVAVELALDARLIADEGAARLYVLALRDAPAHRAITFEAGEARFRELLAVLSRRGVPADYGEPKALTRAVTRALSRRPRLALSAAEAGVLEAKVPALRERVDAAAPALLRALRDTLPSP